jgi:hypothetical protein
MARTGCSEASRHAFGNDRVPALIGKGCVRADALPAAQDPLRDRVGIGVSQRGIALVTPGMLGQ